MKLLTENRREFNLDTHVAFLDYGKAFCKVEREKLFEVLQSKSIPNLFWYSNSSSSSSSIA
jgi:hypothetical protein